MMSDFLCKAGQAYDDILKASDCSSQSSFNLLHDIVQSIIGEDVGPFVDIDSVLKDANPYDLIEIKRRGYSHWTMYLGGGMVQHLEHDYDSIFDLFETRTGNITRKTLKKVAGDDLVRVNNKYLSSQKRKLTKRNNKDILTDLERMNGITIEYNILHKNCEHIVTRWAFGQAFSDQVQ